MIAALKKEEALQQTKIIHVNRGDALDSKKKDLQKYRSSTKNSAVKTYDNSNKISYFDNIEKILTF